MANRTAIVFGVTGISGRAVAERLRAEGGWKVIGVSRKPLDLPGVEHVACDLLDAQGTRNALAGKSATHMFHCTFLPQQTMAENCRVNGAMIENALAATLAGGALSHVAMVTGTSHYFGSPNYETPFTEDQARGNREHFYYTQEDILFAAARERGFTWSVARPATILGYAPGNAMNLGTSLAVYATLSKETGRPFFFPGAHYSSLMDATDARLLAKHLIWEATTPAAAGKAFNVVNGDLFRWDKMWGRIAGYFEIEPAPYPGHATPLAKTLANAGADWEDIVAGHGLMPNRLEAIAPFWHVDADMGRPLDSIADMSRSRELGFLEYQRTWQTFADLFEKLRAERIIP